MNAGEEALEAGDLVAIRGLEGPMRGTDQPILLVQKAGENGTDTVIGVVQGKATIVESVRDEEVRQGAEQAEGPAAPGEYLFTVVQGITNTRVDTSSGPIAVGQRLTAASNPDYARLLLTTSVNDVTVVEGAPVIGIAQAPLDSGTGLSRCWSPCARRCEMKRRTINILVVLVLALLVTGLTLAAAQYNMLTWTAEGGDGRTQAGTYA